MTDLFEASCEISRKLHDMRDVTSDLLANFNIHKSIFLYQNKESNEKTERCKDTFKTIDLSINEVSLALIALQSYVDELRQLNGP